MELIVWLTVGVLMLVGMVRETIMNSELSTKVNTLESKLIERDNKREVDKLRIDVALLRAKVDVMEQEKYFGVIIDEYYVIGLSDDGEPQLGGWVHNIKRFTKKRAESIASEFGGTVIDMRTREELIE